MSKIKNAGITGTQGFHHTCYVATATQNLKDSSPWTSSHNNILWTYQGAKIICRLVDGFFPNCVALMWQCKG